MMNIPIEDVYEQIRQIAEKFEQFSRHLQVLRRADKEDITNEFIISGIIYKFYIQFELGWKVLKELLSYEGVKSAASGSPREIIKAAYAYFDFIDENLWLQMLRDRNDTTHMYNEAAAVELVDKIIKDYIPLFEKMEKAVKDRYEEQ